MTLLPNVGVRAAVDHCGPISLRDELLGEHDLADVVEPFKRAVLPSEVAFGAGWRWAVVDNEVLHEALLNLHEEALLLVCTGVPRLGFGRGAPVVELHTAFEALTLSGEAGELLRRFGGLHVGRRPVS